MTEVNKGVPIDFSSDTSSSLYADALPRPNNELWTLNVATLEKASHRVTI